MKLLLVLSISSIFTFSQFEWELKKEKSEIQIYSRNVTYSSYEEVMGTIVLEGIDLQKVIDVIKDIDNYDQLLYQSENPKTVNHINDSTQVFYIQQKAPWPVKNRDGYYIQTISTNYKSNEIKVEFKTVEQNYPLVPGFVRIKVGSGQWFLKQENNNTEVRYQFHGEPAGDIPAWIVNTFLVSQPYETLKNLKKLVKIQ